MVIVMAKWADANLKLYGNRVAKLHTKYPNVLPRIVNQVGNRAKTQVIRALTAQTGLPRKTIVKAVANPTTARASHLTYEMRTRGGNTGVSSLRRTATSISRSSASACALRAAPSA